MKRTAFTILVSLLLLIQTICPVIAENEETAQESNQATITIEAPSAVLMESSTGTVIFEKASSEQLRPASITKIMTLMLIFDALKEGKINLEDVVTTSEYAASMGGSQVFLEPQEQQTVETLIKCIAIASANDACVVMAEHISGTEEEFVKKMNERAKELGMSQTHFVNCCGLDADGHVTTAMDVALMSRELIEKHPEIHNYSTIWMENITHTTSKGTSEFGLTNTNKLIKQYEYATGLKTGSTSLAKYCVSATAKKDGVEMIAVIMAAPDYKVRFKDASTLLNYGFANCSLYQDEEMPKLEKIRVEKSLKKEASIAYEKDFEYLGMQGENFEAIEKELSLPKTISAPMNKNDKVGALVYSLNGKVIGKADILLTEDIKEASYKDYFQWLCGLWMI